MTEQRLRKKLACLVVALAVLAPSIASAVVPYRVEELFRDKGCQIVKALKVADTELDSESVYVAWCSAVDVYLEVAFCEGLSCKVVEH